MIPFDFQPRTRIIFGPDKLDALGQLASELGARRAMVVSDPGVIAAGHAERGIDALDGEMVFQVTSMRPPIFGGKLIAQLWTTTGCRCKRTTCCITQTL